METRPVKGHFLSIDRNSELAKLRPTCKLLVFRSPKFPVPADLEPIAIPTQPSSFFGVLPSNPPNIAQSSQNFERQTDVRALNGGLGGLESQTDILVPSPSSLSNSALRGTDLLGGEDVRLLLESALGLDGKLSGHGCEWISSLRSGVGGGRGRRDLSFGARRVRSGLSLIRDLDNLLHSETVRGCGLCVGHGDCVLVRLGLSVCGLARWRDMTEHSMQVIFNMSGKRKKRHDQDGFTRYLQKNRWPCLLLLLMRAWGYAAQTRVVVQRQKLRFRFRESRGI
jgi:hypothetical protein